MCLFLLFKWLILLFGIFFLICGLLFFMEVGRVKFLFMFELVRGCFDLEIIVLNSCVNILVFVKV